MNSFNANQAEENRKDLGTQESIQKINEVVKKAQTCFFCTSISIGGSGATRPMSVQQVDEYGNLWFLSANDSNKNKELAINLRFPRYFVCHQVSFMQQPFPDFAYSSSDRETELAIDSRVSNAGGLDYKRLQCIRSWPPSFQHG